MEKVADPIRDFHDGVFVSGVIGDDPNIPDDLPAYDLFIARIRLDVRDVSVCPDIGTLGVRRYRLSGEDGQPSVERSQKARQYAIGI